MKLLIGFIRSIVCHLNHTFITYFVIFTKGNNKERMYKQAPPLYIDIS